MENLKTRMMELVNLLNEASKAYYKDSKEIISNLEFDKLYDELVYLEAKTGITFANSPTANVGYEILESLPKENHGSKMLSLDKTKEIPQLVEWLKDKEGILSFKVDGLTIVLTYVDGKLEKAVTRGNGLIGEVVTNNARVFKNLPLSIPVEGTFVIRGEAYIGYKNFEKINENIEEGKYKNPRNLCSGSVRQLNNEVTKNRFVEFLGFSLVSHEGDSRKSQLEFAESLGFSVVPWKLVDANNIEEGIKSFTELAKQSDIPTDGLVLSYDDLDYGKSLGETAKFPRDSIAFKWEDETGVTTLKEIEWSPSRTGLINPVAIFNPVELEGTTVTRASVHNISILKELNLVPGDEIEVYKANMIIPQISKNLKKEAIPVDQIEIPAICPICRHETEIKNDTGVEALFCLNPSCPAKKIKEFAHFASRDAMNIEGMSEATIERLIEIKALTNLPDLYNLPSYKEEIEKMEGFGEKSYENLVSSIEKSKRTEDFRLLYGLGIAGIGVANAKLILKECNFEWEDINKVTKEELIEINGVGPIMAESFVNYFAKEDNLAELKDLLGILKIEKSNNAIDGAVFEGKNFVITGGVEEFKNRNEVKLFIEKLGGKVTGSVSAKTNYLVNNDTESNSSKNKKAKELGVEIISEKQLIELGK